jgi:hypothetical protein
VEGVSSGGTVVAGVVFVVGLAIVVFLIVVKRRHDAKFRRNPPAPRGHP